MTLLAVIGMHRSGTSMVAGMLRAAGWDVGPSEQLMLPKPDNPRGFVEHLPAMRINDRVLSRLGGMWKEPPAMPPGWEHDTVLDGLREEAAEVAAALVARPADRVLFKDPRLSLTLPFWQTVTEIDQAVLVLRAPDPVVRSLLRREDDMDTDRAATLWLRYVLTALRHDVTLHQVVPGDLLEDVDGELSRLGTALGAPPSEEDLAAAREQVDGELWGRSSRRQDTEPLDGAAMAAARQVHELLTGDDAARWRVILGQLAAVDEVATADARLHALRVALSATNDELRERVEGLRRTLEETRARADRLLAERERARELHDAVRAERDAAVEQLAAADHTATTDA